MNKIKLAVFDLDGTVLDTLKDLSDSVNYALSQSGFPLRTMDEIRCFVGNGIANLIKRAIPENTGEEDFQRVFATFKSHYALHCADFTKPYEGINELLISLKNSGIKTALFSNKADEAVQKLAVRYFDGLFDYVAGEKEGVRRKPAPDGVINALNFLHTPVTSAVYIGDSEVDIQTAVNSCLPCISVTWGFRDEEFLKNSGAQITVHSVKELEQAIFSI